MQTPRHAIPINALATQLGTDVGRGLSSPEAAERLEQTGSNELRKGEAISPLAILLSQFRSLVIWVLIGAAVVSAALGEFVDGIAIIAIVLLNALIGFFQEYRAERAAALARLTAPRAKVVRGGQAAMIAASEVVPGDLLLLDAGDLVAADARLLEASAMRAMDVGQTIESAIGGENIHTTIEGRERYPINVRYLRELRDDPEKLKRVLVMTPTGAQVPLAQLATLRFLSGPPMIRDEDGMLSGYVYVDMAGRDVGGYVEDLKRVVREKVQLPPGYTMTWSGQYEFMQRAQARLLIVVPLTLAIIFVLFYLEFRSTAETLMVMLGLPLCLVGAIWYLALLEYNMSIAVWVGILALAGTAAETSAAMLVYLDSACARRKTAGGLLSFQDLLDTVHAGAVERIRPIVMVSIVDILGLVPTMWATGTGADVMKRLAAPTVGGVMSGLLLTLFVIPVIYTIWRWRTDVKHV
jgi:hypothetical protein